MKRKTTGILISCVVSICCMVVLSMSSHTHDVYASYSRYVTANNVVVRKKASNKGKIVGSYKKAAKVRCYKKKRSYTKIKYGRYYRYIATRYLSKKKPVVGSYKKAANITTDTYTRYVTASSLTIRKKASTSAAKAGSYKKGTQITCYGERSGWTTVRYSGVYCYVSSQYLSESRPEEDTWEVYGTATGQSVVVNSIRKAILMYGVEKALRMELTVLDSRCRYINILDIHCHTVQQHRDMKEQQYHGMRSSQEI